MLSHVSLGVSDLERARTFYDAVLGSLGYRRAWSTDRGIGYGPDGGGDQLALFLVSFTSRPLAAGRGFHVAFTAPDRAAVDLFHAAALRNGGRDEGSPRLRTQYGPSYYAAFVRDPDGHKLEAVHR